MMKTTLFLLTIILTVSYSIAQDFSGSWSGFLMTGGKDMESSDIIYLSIEGMSEKVSGLSRIELLNDEMEFAVKSFNGTVSGNTIKLTEDIVRRSSKTRKSPECKLNFDLVYDAEKAYLKGTFLSSDCRNNMGEVLFFRSDHEVNIEKEPTTSHAWKHFFIRNYKKGYPAPEVMREEQKNFKFKAIYFDHDKSEVKPEYYDYLNKMARVLDGIHDLRVKVTGHTDAIGTDGYNMGLSERRSDAIRAYFKTQGVNPEKLVIDFKGKREPIDSNDTKEGKQRNRRVVFEFAY